MMKKYSTYSSTILKKYQQLHRQVAHALNNGQFSAYTQRKQQQLLKRLSRYERRLQRWGIAVVGFSGLMMGTPAIYAQTASGSEFQVNTYTTNSQSSPSIAMDSDGDFVVVWESKGQDGDDYGIYAQRYDNTGATVGTEFQVNTYTTSVQRNPSVAMDSDGDFVVAWESNYQDGNYYGIYAQRYDNTGATVGLEFQVNTYTTSQQQTSSVSMDSDGDFVIAWQSGEKYNNFIQDGDRHGVYAQRYSNTGAIIDAEFQVNTYTTGSQERPSVAMDSDGNFVIAWQSGFTYGGQQDGNYFGIYAQRYNNAGATVGTEFQVNTYTTGYQDFPNVAMDSDGDFVVVWQSYGQDGSSEGIYRQQYDNTGASIGTEFQVNTHVIGRQFKPSVAIDSDGDFVVIWESFGQDGSNRGIYGQRYSPPAPTPSVSVAIEGMSASTENSSNTLTFRFSRNMTGIADPLTIDFSLAGTAIQDTDYTINANANINLTDMELTFPANVDEVDMVLTLTGDSLVEESETIVVTILPTGP